ncbi:hypothetical protein KC320_g8420 [Hortaea werneckii]|nr:hypothetical protein KC320_g8420 [Hortaea werneckii]
MAQSTDATSLTTPEEWSKFIMSLRPLIRSAYVSRMDEALAEAEGIEVMKGWNVLIRAYESAPHDFVVAIASKDAVDIPDKDSTTHELWKWATRQKDAQFLAMDVKYYRLVNSIFSHRREYSFNPNKKKAIHNVGSNGEFPQVAVLVFEGIQDYLALLPYHTWRLGGTCGTVLQSLEQTIPLWCQPFMVHYNDLAAAVLDMTSALKARKGSYRNPTTGVVLEGWRLRATRELQI